MPVVRVVESAPGAWNVPPPPRAFACAHAIADALDTVSSNPAKTMQAGFTVPFLVTAR
jgi:hypothetical protein